MNHVQWTEFIETGEVCAARFPEIATGFSFFDLSRDQMWALRRFLESESAFVPMGSPLLGFLRVNLRE